MRTVFTYTCVVLLLMLITVDSSPKKPRNKPKNAGPKVVSVAENDVRKNPPKKEAAKRQIKKSHHYIDPKILDRLSRVRDLKDVVREFNPKGYSIRMEKVFKKVTSGQVGPSGPCSTSVGEPGTPGIPGRPGAPTSKGSSGPDGDVYEEQLEETVYYQDQKVADSLQLSPDQQIGCNPKDTPITIASLGVITIPMCVVLKKCGGCCEYAKECVTATTKSKTVQVMEIDDGNFNTVTKTFVEDETCQCDCIVKASDCYPKQTYSKDRCQCECHLSPQSCPTGKMWSKPECDCICDNRRDCNSSVRKWDESSCSCGCIDTACPAGQTRNHENCLCA